MSSIASAYVQSLWHIYLTAGVLMADRAEEMGLQVAELASRPSPDQARIADYKSTIERYESEPDPAAQHIKMVVRPNGLA